MPRIVSLLFHPLIHRIFCVYVYVYREYVIMEFPTHTQHTHTHHGYNMLLFSGPNTNYRLFFFCSNSLVFLSVINA